MEWTQIQRYAPLRSSHALGNNRDHIFSAPVTATYKVMLFGSSGSGVYGSSGTDTDEDGDEIYWVQDGSGGGSGGCAASIVKLNAGDTVDLYIGEGACELTHPRTAEDSKVVFHPTTGETYSNLVVTAGQNGGRGGQASGGNYVNKNGDSGEQGSYDEYNGYDPGILPGGGSGGWPITVDGVTGTRGGEGGYQSYGDGQDGFVVIFLGNTAPDDPLSITYGQPQAGRQLTLTTGGSTDDDGDEITYVFERSIDGGVYTEVGQTIELSINDTVPTTGTTYLARVKAVDSVGGESDYVLGEPMAINYNSAPEISGTDANLGTVTAPPVYNYTVTDADGGAVTVVEKVTTASGKEHTLRTYTATLGAETSVRWNCHCWVCCENGMNTLTITATDSSGAKAVRTVRFYREVGCIMAARAVATDAMPTKVFLSLYPAPVMLPGDCTIEAYVTNNPFDDSPVWEDISDKLNMIVHTFANSTCKNGYGIGYKFCIDKGEEKVYFDQATLRFA